MKKLKQWLNSKSIRNNLKNTIITVGLLPVFICGFIVYFFISSMQWNDVVNQTNNRAVRMADSINIILANAIDYSSAIVFNTRILNGISNDFTENTSEKVEFYEMLDMYFDNYKLTTDTSDNDCIIYHDNSSLFKSKHTLPLSTLGGGLQNSVLNQGFDQPVWENAKDHTSIYRRMMNTGDFKAVLGISIPYKHFETLIDNFLADGTEKIRYEITDNADEASLYLSKNLINGTYLCAQIPPSIKHGIYLRNFLLIFSVLLVFSVALFVCANLLSRFLTQKIDKFIENLNKNETLEDFRKIQFNEDDEFAFIYNKIKALIQKIDDIHLTLNKTLTEKNVLELEYMQSKINPHLLYNSLSSMKWNAMDNGDKTAVQNISALTQYYRAVLSGGKNIITLSQEIDLVQKYIKVMEFAHKHPYPYEINIEPELSSQMTIKHLLQPFVENAILHGINRMENGKIKIEAFKLKNHTVLTVTDNGCGIPPEKLENIRQMTYSSDYRSYGIKNTLRRIRLYYGDDCNIEIESAPNIKTVIKITLCDLKPDALFEQYHFLND